MTAPELAEELLLIPWSFEPRICDLPPLTSVVLRASAWLPRFDEAPLS